ncbi:MAG TPA: hypothetical protein VLF66_18275 [Thermoanaerobaculia bacterium]|nr:hypothetical protein [Thermoanaerobaculia bacterium]
MAGAGAEDRDGRRAGRSGAVIDEAHAREELEAARGLVERIRGDLA